MQLPPISGQSTVGNVYEFNAWVAENPQSTSISADQGDLTVKVGVKLSSLMTVAVGS